MIQPCLATRAENEKRLQKKFKELNAELVSSAGKVGAALKISEADQATIAGLRREAEKAWKVVKDSQDKARRREAVLMVRSP